MDGPGGGGVQQGVDAPISSSPGSAGLPSRSAMPSSDGALAASNHANPMLCSDGLHDQALGSQWHAGNEQRRLSQGGGDSSLHAAGMSLF
jgi:hypothetical protein